VGNAVTAGAESSLPEIYWQRRAPDLLALLAAEIAEELDEPGNEVELAEHHIDGDAHAQFVGELLEPLPDRARVSKALLRRLHRELGDADANERAIDRLTGPVALEEAKESFPRSLIDGGVAVERRVTPRVSSNTASSANHQSQLRVPPTPRVASLPYFAASGKLRPELRSAVVLPEPGGPMMMYHGSW